MSYSESNVATLPLAGQRVGDVAANRLRSLVERIEALEQQRRDLGEDVKEVYVEVKVAGFDTKVVRHLVQERRKEPEEIELFDTLLETYRRALGD